MSFGSRHRVAVSIVVTCLLVPHPARAVDPPRPDPDEALIASSRAQHVARDALTGRVTFLGASPGNAMPRPTGISADAVPERAARAFLGRYAKLFGIGAPTADLRPTRQRPRPDGGATVRFEQVHRGVPVMAGELVVNLDAERNVLSVSGEATPFPALDVQPTIDAAAATAVAMDVVADGRGVSRGRLAASGASLMVYDPALLGAPDPGPVRLVWRIDVDSRGGAGDGAELDELVLVDAHAGAAVLRFDQVRHARDRRVCDNANSPGASDDCNEPFTRSEGEDETGTTEVDLAYQYSGQWYDFFASRFGRDSYDGNGAPLVSTVRHCRPAGGGGCFSGSYWTGHAVFADGEAVDDIVAHEFTHGLTQAEAGFWYFAQSGALDESFADIFGEFVDLLNAGTPDSGSDTASSRWKLFEDAPYPSFLRDMKDPGNPEVWGIAQPDRMTSEAFFSYPGDNYGVHINSGVGNKTAYLLVDGDTFNGWTINPIGLEKTARIEYEALTNLLTSGSDYRDLYDLLPQACRTLVGTAGIASSDCLEVRKAVTATEMHLDPIDPGTNGRGEAAMCPALHVVSAIYATSFETGDPSWTSSGAPADVWSNVRHYATSGSRSWFARTAPNPTATDSPLEMDVAVPLPAGVSYLHFRHAHDLGTESGGANADGGVVEYSADDGAWTDAGALFDANGYVGSIGTGSGNPLAGRSAFTGHSKGYYSSRLDLTPLAGSTARFRFRVGANSLQDGLGWYVDDVTVYTCAAAEDTSSPIASIDVVSTATPRSGLDAVGSRSVEVKLAADDGVAGGGVTSMRFRNAGGSWSAWTPFAPSSAWTLMSGDGLKRVDGQVRDAAGNRSAVVADEVELDRTSPTVARPVERFAVRDRVTADGVPIRFRLSALDAGVGVDHITLFESIDGGPETSWGGVNGPSGTVLLRRVQSPTTHRAFYASAFDAVGNGASSAFGPSFVVRLRQDTSATLNYSSDWENVDVADASGGTVTRTETIGEVVRFTLTARDIAIIATKGPDRGRIDIYIDGTKATSSPIDLYRDDTLTRSIVFARSFKGAASAHAIRVVVRSKSAQSSGSVVDLDAIPYLR